MSSSLFYCKNRCCKLFKSSKIINEPWEFINDKTPKQKSGVFIIDTNNKLLISQSYNSFWGIPKGTKEQFETNEETSIRETKEETGIVLSKDIFKNSEVVYFSLKKNTYHLFLIRLFCSGEEPLLPHLLHTESTGCGWIDINCLLEMHFNKKIKLNYITLNLINNFSKQSPHN